MELSLSRKERVCFNRIAWMSENGNAVVPISRLEWFVSSTILSFCERANEIHGLSGGIIEDKGNVIDIRLSATVPGLILRVMDGFVAVMWVPQDEVGRLHFPE